MANKVTVRAWFRLQRGAIWARGDRFASNLERVTALVVAGDDPCSGTRPIFSDGQPVADYRMGDVLVVRNITYYEARERLRVLARESLDRAMDETRHARIDPPMHGRFLDWYPADASWFGIQRTGTPPRDITG